MVDDCNRMAPQVVVVQGGAPAGYNQNVNIVQVSSPPPQAYYPPQGYPQQGGYPPQQPGYYPPQQVSAVATCDCPFANLH